MYIDNQQIAVDWRIGMGPVFLLLLIGLAVRSGFSLWRLDAAGPVSMFSVVAWDRVR